MQHLLIPHQLPALTLSILSKHYGNKCEVIRFHLLLRHPFTRCVSLITSITSPPLQHSTLPPSLPLRTSMIWENIACHSLEMLPISDTTCLFHCCEANRCLHHCQTAFLQQRLLHSLNKPHYAENLIACTGACSSSSSINVEYSPNIMDSY